MKVKLHNFLFFSILFQVFSTQAVVTYNILKPFGYGQLKSLVHPLGVFLTIWYFVSRCNKFYKVKLDAFEILFFGYFTLVFLFLVFNVNSLENFYIVFREVFLIFILIFIYRQGGLPLALWHKILKVLYVLCIVNIAFVALTFILGPEEYMKLISGRYVWGLDPELKFRITNIKFLWRSPALIGDSAASGLFGVLTLFLFIKDEKYKKKIFIPLLLVLLSFTRSIYLTLVVFLFLNFITQRKNLKILTLALPYIGVLLFLIAIMLYKLNLLSVESLILRFKLWAESVNVDFSWLYGGSIGKVGGSVRDQGFLAILDNYWLLMLISSGLIGIVIVLLFFYKNSFNNRYLHLMLIAFLISGLFVTLTQSMTFLVLFPLLFLKIEEEYNIEKSG